MTDYVRFVSDGGGGLGVLLNGTDVVIDDGTDPCCCEGGDVTCPTFAQMPDVTITVSGYVGPHNSTSGICQDCEGLNGTYFFPASSIVGGDVEPCALITYDSISADSCDATFDHTALLRMSCCNDDEEFGFEHYLDISFSLNHVNFLLTNFLDSFGVTVLLSDYYDSDTSTYDFSSITSLPLVSQLSRFCDTTPATVTVSFS
jgi:hypothetical protein